MSQRNEQADKPAGWVNRGRSWHYWLKRWKARRERRRAKKNPECKPGYGRYDGYEL